MEALFGTDGIRRRVGARPITPEGIIVLGRAIGQKFGAGATAFIGRDTRLSGEMFEVALAAGLMSQGVQVVSLGIIPTPAVSFLTATQNADFGIMLTASHNPFHDNGLKIFGANGNKLSIEDQADIEAYFHQMPSISIDPAVMGTRTYFPEAQREYIKSVRSSLPEDTSFTRKTIVLDLANGAGSFVGASVFSDLGIDIITIGDTPDGVNINAECGSTAPVLLSQTVLAERAALGLALDGDGDRLICVDEKGQVIDGDQILACLARHHLEVGTLKGGTIVSTIMANQGFDMWAKAQGLTLERTKVGDKYVSERMRAVGANLGGEQSGHLILSDYAATGDGLLAALQILLALDASGLKMSAFAHVFDPYPQKLINLPISGPNPLQDKQVTKAIEKLKKAYGKDANIVIRKSGTENVIRIMAQAKDDALVDHITKEVKGLLSNAI